MSDGLLREELVQWVTRYKDVVERNALAETPEETADYLLSLLPPVRAHTLKEVALLLTKLIDEQYGPVGAALITMNHNYFWNGILPGENDGGSK